MGTTPEQARQARRHMLLNKEWTEQEWEKLPPAPPLVPAYQRPTALDYARECWRRERWGEPLNYGQTRMWTLFFTTQGPHERLIHQSWTRPSQWIEDLIRYPYPPRRCVRREVVLVI